MKKIIIKGAKEHNLKNINLEIPRDKLVVFTGLSGSGKSTLAFDTIFAEGQRRYLESLSSYARQFLGQMEKPEVDLIEGLSPAISIDQKSVSHNPRSTVGTVTEIHDYLRLLFAKIGKYFCPICQKEISKLSTDEIVEKILEICLENQKTKNQNCLIEILSPLVRQRKGEFQALFEEMFKRGFSKVFVNDQKFDLIDRKKIKLEKYKKHSIDLFVDEVEVDSENISRIFDAVEQALKFSDGLVKIVVKNGKKTKEKLNKEFLFNQKLSCSDHDISFPNLEPRFFSFNSPYGACPACEGLGTKKEIDENLIMPDKNKTIAEGGILPWSYKRNNYYGTLFQSICRQFGISENKRIRDFSSEELKIVLYGPDDDYDKLVKIKYNFRSGSNYFNIYWNGILDHLKKRYIKTQSESVRKEIEKYMNNKACQECKGTRYNQQVLWVKIGGKNIAQLSQLSISELADFLRRLKLNFTEKIIAERILKEIEGRLSFLINVGLEYLSLARSANTLSGGESQRIRLASQIGSGLVGVLYILDEPSIGLHARDNEQLLKMLLKLKKAGNTVIVIEHDEKTILSADYVVDIGPGAGEKGGKIVFAGKTSDFLQDRKSLTAQYLRKEKEIFLPKTRRKSPKGKQLIIKNATQNNLKNISVEIPLKVFVCVTGVSGSGKSSLIEDVLYKWLANRINRSLDIPGRVKEIVGYHNINKVLMIDQSPIGRTPRSNPATYTGFFTSIRKIFSMTKEARVRGYGMGRFSFNVNGGRCENCKGEGFLRVEMQFMPDVFLPCEVCRGKRYNSETLKIKYKEKNIADILEMTVDEAVEFFGKIPEIVDKIKTLQDVGLGYIRLGQSATTFSGGEAQRIKLASELSKKSTGNTLYILDEPTTGLHFEDIKKLLKVLHRLVDLGNTVIVIEHNLDVIKTADYIIDLGPEGGEAGGRVIAVGTPEELISNFPQSWTAQYLRKTIKI